MNVDAIAPALVEDLTARIEAARREATEACGPGDADSAEYWQAVFERNAAAVLARVPEVRLPPGFAVRYVFYGRQRGDLLTRPLITRAGLELDSVRSHLEWHAPPDSLSVADQRPTQDVELLYRHFSFEHTPAGYFTYWVVLQEIWASARWVHSRLLADAAAFEALIASGEWSVCLPVERFEPCAVVDPQGGCDLVVLSHRWVGANSVDLLRVRVEADQSIRFLDPIHVAGGPRGYLV